MNKEDYTNERGRCHKCHGLNLDYGAIEIEDTMCYYPYKCEDCGQEGEEWYNLDFAGHNVYDEDGKEIIL